MKGRTSKGGMGRLVSALSGRKSDSFFLLRAASRERRANRQRPASLTGQHFKQRSLPFRPGPGCALKTLRQGAER